MGQRYNFFLIFFWLRNFFFAPLQIFLKRIDFYIPKMVRGYAFLEKV